jgi:hypothetical protein
MYRPVYIKFLDHYQADMPSMRPVVCEVFGTLVESDKMCHYVCSWVCEGNLTDHNSDGYCILKSTVLDLKYLKGGPRDAPNASRYKRSKSNSKANRKKLRA